jgi:signal transduction histidine kinase
MTVSNRPRISEIRMGNDALHSPAKKVPLTVESLAVLGHEIRNPLSALSYALEAWPASKGDPHLEEQLLQIMRRQVLQLTRLCNDLLDVGKSARGSLSICRASVDARQIIQNACQQIQPFVEQCGHRLTVTLSESPLCLLGDESRLTQVFANLIHNSAKFTDRNGHLRIWSRYLCG